jgi:hypothetical protein
MKATFQSVLSDLLVSVGRRSPGAFSSPPKAVHEIEEALDAWAMETTKGLPARIPHVAFDAALIARLRFALLVLPTVEAHFRLLAKAEDEAVDEALIWEWLLVRMWHERGRSLWLEGKLQG